ncbi:hypothetical protein PAXRUDRAFT_15225 [Paxillus rubicundulus Ve08.2h10]|uniref:Uncharacterized protein n=1 Tax=Paxillus rubicundulus Ve08.2h10 TaxID=930991 RepID=A0A0D0DQ96_9AGAM|nr:hypothetical protein PAXRUDRAFT_15225 [Paxillus rubicundulus Ve08.2h10]
MAVIAINKILDEVQAKYLPSAKVPLVMIAAEMQMFPIDQVVTRGWPLLQAILRPGPEVNTHIWAQVPKLILKGKGVDPLERGGAMEAGGSKLDGKQALDGNQGGKGGEKGKKKEKKEKKEKNIERVATGSDAGPTQGLNVIEPDCHPSTPGNPIPTSLQQLLQPLHLANQELHKKVREGHPCRGMPPLPPGKAGLQFIPAGQATSGAVEGSNPSPGTSEGSIPRPFQRPCSSIHLGNIEAAGYPLKVGPKFGTWPLPIKEGQGLGLQIEAKDFEYQLRSPLPSAQPKSLAQHLKPALSSL